ncbi:MAG: S-ribosylhomocysteine lyase [Erysipelotrichaceae bacterium]|nr:S-ribosylhomocysteine lyase [Erysipelotrichaceae bacterium]
MERIASFSVDHTKLKKGIYVSRVDDDLITWDIRMTEPNNEPYIDPKASHTIEHIGATLLRNGIYKDHIIYFGPMGCLTGFYLITRNLSEEQVIPMVKDVMRQISQWSQTIPGAKAEECGNYTYMNLEGAKSAARHFIEADLEFKYHYL